MATPLKFMYNAEYFEQLCPIVQDALPNLDSRTFVYLIFDNQWPDLELKDRIRKISQALHSYLSKDFAVASKQLLMITNELKCHFRPQAFENIFLADYVQVYGLDHPDEALHALEQITKHVSAEFAVRPFIRQYPEKSLKYLLKWSLDRDENVRRLASEGCRPRLPWASTLPDFIRDPSPILPVLENLMNDPSAYVRNSVANNLNDIGKDNPDILVQILRKWKGKTAYTDWILRHGCRSLLKNAHAEVLTLHGFNPNVKAGVRNLIVPSVVRIGEKLGFTLDFINRERKPAYFRLEYAIDYVTSTGRTSRKIFKLSENLFEPGKVVSISRKQSFKNFSTRKHYKGRHYLRILANGKKLATREFLVR